jgi:hypothetical protein
LDILICVYLRSSAATIYHSACLEPSRDEQPQRLLVDNSVIGSARIGSQRNVIASN